MVEGPSPPAAEPQVVRRLGESRTVLELGKFVVAAGTIIAIMYSIGWLARTLATRLGLNEKFVTNAIVLLVFLVSSYFWIYTDFPKRLERWTGIPVAREPK